MQNKAVSSPADGEENTRFCFNVLTVHSVHWKQKVLTSEDESQCLSALLLHMINITVCLWRYLGIDVLTILQG